MNNEESPGSEHPLRQASGAAAGGPLNTAGILALQRSAGNQAVCNLLRSSPIARSAPVSVQRDVGFEFEANWLTYQYDPKDNWPTSKIEPRSGPIGQLETSDLRGDKLLPPLSKIGKGETMVEAAGVELQADESRGGGSDMEYVTDPFPESKEGREQLDRAMTTVRKMNDVLVQNQNLYTSTPELSDHGEVKMQNALIRKVKSGLFGSPQATGAIRLDALADLVKRATATNEEGKSTLARSELMGMGKEGAADPLRSAVTDAEWAVVEWPKKVLKAKRTPAPIGKDSRTLVGLTTLLVSYLRRGDSEELSYAKNIAPIMARTDFAAMFKTLPDNEQAYFKRNKGEKFMDFILFAAKLEKTGSKPVFVKGLNYDTVKNRNALKHLTRKAWLTNIANGTDMMTAAHIGKNAAGEMESLGRLGSQQEKIGSGAEAPIFELRRMKQSVPYDEWKDLALRVFDHIVSTNEMSDKEYGA